MSTMFVPKASGASGDVKHQRSESFEASMGQAEKHRLSRDETGDGGGGHDGADASSDSMKVEASTGDPSKCSLWCSIAIGALLSGHPSEMVSVRR